MDQLRKEGWNINETQVSDYFDDGILPKSGPEILKTILNEDLRNFAEAAIINKKEETSFEGPCVLQLLRYRNVSVPRIKEELNQTDPAHSIIRLFLTDGHTAISALILQSIPGITSETPPGTKIQIIGTVPIEGNFLILERKNVKILGGRVEEMIEKWNVEKSSVRADGFKSSVGKGTGAPKWVSFGKRGQQGHLEKGFKANAVMPKTLKEDDVDDNFSKNRAEIIAELKDDTAKTFSKPNLAPPPQKAPAPPKPPKERAERPPRPQKKGRGRKNSEDGPDVDLGEYANHRPSGPATLFDFIGGGGEKGAELAAEMTAKMTVSDEKKKFEKGGGGSGGNFKKNEGGGSGRDQKPRGPKTFPEGQKRENRPNTTGGSSQNFRQKSENQRPSTASSGAPRSNQASQQGQGPSQSPRGNFNKGPKSENPRVNAQNSGYQKDGQKGGGGGPRDGNKGFQMSQERGGPHGNQQYQKGPNPQQNQGPSQNPRGNQMNQGGPRGNFQQNQVPQNLGQNPAQNFQRGPPRGNFQGPQNPRGIQQNFPQNQGGPLPRGNQYNQQQQHNYQPRPFAHFQQAPPPPPQGPRFHPQNFQQGPPGPPFGPTNQNHPECKVGGKCLAPWNDGRLYASTISEILPNRRQVVVKYNEFGNFETVPIQYLVFP